MGQMRLTAVAYPLAEPGLLATGGVPEDEPAVGVGGAIRASLAAGWFCGRLLDVLSQRPMRNVWRTYSVDSWFKVSLNRHINTRVECRGRNTHMAL